MLGISRRSLLLAAPGIILGGMAMADTKKIKLINEEFHDEGISKYNFSRVLLERGIDMGCALPRQQMFPFSGKPSEIIQRDFSTIVPEVDFNWVSNNVPDTEYFLELNTLKAELKFSQDFKKKLKGHPLYYHQVHPEALIELASNPKNSTSEIEKTLYRLVYNRVARYKGKVDHWVINEIFDYQGRLVDEPVSKRLGEKFVGIVCAAALDADPNTWIELNDNNIGLEGSERAVHSIISLIDRLKSDGIVINQVGCQCHFALYRGSDWDETPSMSLKPYKKLKQAGLKFSITEIDVDDRGFDGTIAERDLAVANVYYSFLSQVAKMSNLTEVTSWSPFDASNWIKRGDKPSAKGRVGDAASRAGWFDVNFEPKLSYFATAKALLDAS